MSKLLFPLLVILICAFSGVWSDCTTCCSLGTGCSTAFNGNSGYCCTGYGYFCCPTGWTCVSGGYCRAINGGAIAGIVIGALVFCGLFEEFYKYETLTIGRCQIKSIDIKYLRNNFYPYWNVNIENNNKTLDETLIGKIGFRSDRLASIEANKYQMNKTYKCYHSRNSSSIIQWGWQWNKPTHWKIYPFLFVSILLVFLAIILLFFKKNYQKKINHFFQQEQYQQLQSTETHQTNVSIPNTPV